MPPFFLNSIRVTFLYVFASVALVKPIFGLLIYLSFNEEYQRERLSIVLCIMFPTSLIGGCISIALVWRELFSKKRVSEVFSWND